MSEQEQSELVRSLVGAEAIYREGQGSSRGFSRVRVHDVQANNWGVSASIELIPTPGLQNNRPAKWGIDSVWKGFSCSRDRWGIAYLGLAVYFGDDLVRAVVEFCSRLPAEYSSEHLAQIFEFLSEYWAKERKAEMDEGA